VRIYDGPNRTAPERGTCTCTQKGEWGIGTWKGGRKVKKWVQALEEGEPWRKEDEASTQESIRSGRASPGTGGCVWKARGRAFGEEGQTLKVSTEVCGKDGWDGSKNSVRKNRDWRTGRLGREMEAEAKGKDRTERKSFRSIQCKPEGHPMGQAVK